VRWVLVLLVVVSCGGARASSSSATPTSADAGAGAPGPAPAPGQLTVGATKVFWVNEVDGSIWFDDRADTLRSTQFGSAPHGVLASQQDHVYTCTAGETRLVAMAGVTTLFGAVCEGDAGAPGACAIRSRQMSGSPDLTVWSADEGTVGAIVGGASARGAFRPGILAGGQSAVWSRERGGAAAIRALADDGTAATIAATTGLARGLCVDGASVAWMDDAGVHEAAVPTAVWASADTKSPHACSLGAVSYTHAAGKAFVAVLDGVVLRGGAPDPEAPEGIVHGVGMAPGDACHVYWSMEGPELARAIVREDLACAAAEALGTHGTTDHWPKPPVHHADVDGPSGPVGVHTWHHHFHDD